MSITVVKQNYSERLAMYLKNTKEQLESMLASRDRYELSVGCKEILRDEKDEDILKFIEENHSPEEIKKYLVNNNIISDRYE